MDVGCEALGAGTSRSDRPLAAANGRKPHAGQPSGTVHVLDAVALESAMERWGDTSSPATWPRLSPASRPSSAPPCTCSTSKDMQPTR